MALGTATDIIAGESYTIDMLAAAITSGNGIPSGSNGVDINVFKALGAVPSSIRFLVVSTAGSGTMTATVKIWGKFGANWAVAKALNGGSAIAETGSDTINYSEEVTGLEGASRVYFELNAVAGTNTAIMGYAVVVRGSAI